jgi:integrase/recombinase XerD
MFATPHPPDRPCLDPVCLYLDQLAPGSRRVMRASLELIADCLSQGRHSARAFAWHKSSYADAARLKSWLERTYAPSTTARHLSAWRGVLRECWGLGMDSNRYLRAVSVRCRRGGPRRPQRLLPAEEIASLLAVKDPSPWDARDVAIVAVLAGTGIRRAELCACDLADVDLLSGALVVRCGKGGRSRRATIPSPLLPYVRRWVGLRGDFPGALFCPLGNSGRVLPRRLSVSAVAWTLHRLAKSAGGPGLSPHCLRRFWITGLLESGVDVLTVGALAGHASPTTTARYDLRRPCAAPSLADPLFERLAAGKLRIAGEEAA